MSVIVNPHVLWYSELCYNVVRDNILFIVSLLNCQYLDIKLQKGFHNHEEIFKNQLFLLKKVCFLVRLWPIVTFSFYMKSYYYHASSRPMMYQTLSHRYQYLKLHISSTFVRLFQCLFMWSEHPQFLHHDVSGFTLRCKQTYLSM